MVRSGLVACVLIDGRLHLWRENGDHRGIPGFGWGQSMRGPAMARDLSFAYERTCFQ